ncbi:CPXV002 protein [Cowpox virus]|uniref:CPXV002 protein n=2 Tax=Cowpox virus TaxID=10243 RepID=Q85306_CWPXB|nr:CPXV228 protein [Cowpox virus]NP_851781.1 CPXV002 protein [Cowpox virus]AAA60950.1 CPXV228 protein [Cowpox virus]AAP41050.1 CPXV002 protein [Cowpox virus]QEM24884.1 CPXV002 protein [Cowpox virus]UWJ24751.1 CPXV002 [Cowpox virus]UWJ24983.1 CPXV228 [Cowpox virus]
MSRVNRAIQAHHKLKKVYRTLYSGLQNKNVLNYIHKKLPLATSSFSVSICDTIMITKILNLFLME